MLVLTRKQNEKIQIGDNVTITIVRLKGKRVRIGIDAPRQCRVLRGEVAFELPTHDQIPCQPETALAVEPAQATTSSSVNSNHLPNVAGLTDVAGFNSAGHVA